MGGVQYLIDRGHKAAPAFRWSVFFCSVTRPTKCVTVLIGGRAISMENTRVRARASTSVNVTVGRGGREYLTEREVEQLIEAAKQNRSGHLVAYRHGLRAAELVALRWDDIDLTTGRLHLRRAKGGEHSRYWAAALCGGPKVLNRAFCSSLMLA
jgi:integrase